MKELWSEWVRYLHSGTLVFVKFLFASLISYMIDFRMLFLTLGWAMFFDLITGILAYKKINNLKWFERRDDYVIKSKFLRVSFEKMGAYLIIILCMAIFETHIFKIEFNYINNLVGHPFYGTAIVTTLCIMIEYWSVLENLKKMDIHVIRKIIEIIIKIKKIKDRITK